MRTERSYCGEKGIHIYHLDLKETSFERLELLKKFNIFNDFCKLFDISIEELDEILTLLCRQDNSLFDYCYYKTQNSILVEEKAIEQKRWVKDGYNYKEVKTYLPLCIEESRFADLPLSDVAKVVVKRKFPAFFEKPFVKSINRFDSSIEKLPKDINTRITDIRSELLFRNKLTIADLINLYTTPNYAQNAIEKTIASIYSDGNIFIDLGGDKTHGHSLYLKITDLLNKDWKAVEERNVISVYISEKNWYNGPQKGAPYFNHKLVNLIKKTFFE